MRNQLPKLIYSHLAPTRDYLQDIARIVGKVQQLFIPPHPHDWQRGLCIQEQGLSTQVFLLGSTRGLIKLNFTESLLLPPNNSAVPLDFSAQDTLSKLQDWMKKYDVTRTIEKPEFLTTKCQLDFIQAQNIATVFNWVGGVFEALKHANNEGNFSPVLVYPHHFDVSLVYFANKAIQTKSAIEQIGMGFSLGDETIVEPYFYVTVYPEPQNFHQLKLPSGTHWQTEGFSGMVVTYKDIVERDDPEALIGELFALVTQSYS